MFIWRIPRGIIIV